MSYPTRMDTPKYGETLRDTYTGITFGRVTWKYLTRPNYKLPFAKRPFLRAKREVPRNARAENAFASQILIGCRDVKQLRSANEILRIPFQSQGWRELLWMSSWVLSFCMEKPGRIFCLKEQKKFPHSEYGTGRVCSF